MSTLIRVLNKNLKERTGPFLKAYFCLVSFNNTTNI